MIKFFREIRQTLIMENKTSKYLKYAIGEIVLVVIGIMIALQVNNWNEKRKENKQELYLLNQIKKDIQSDSSLLASYIRLTYGKTLQAKRLRKAVVNKRYNMSKDSLVINAFFIGKLVLFDPYIPTFDELVSSGKLSIIKSEKLKSSLKRYIKVNDGAKTFMYDESQKKKEDYNTHIYQYLEPQIMTFLWESSGQGSISIDSLNSYKIDVEGFINDPKTLYHINTMIGIDRDLNWQYKERRIQRIQDIIDIVNDEIANYHD